MDEVADIIIEKFALVANHKEERENIDLECELASST